MCVDHVWAGEFTIHFPSLAKKVNPPPMPEGGEAGVSNDWCITYRIFVLTEMKKIHSVLYIKLSKVLSNAYDKTGLVNHSTKPQRKEDDSNSQNNIKLILS